MGPGHMDMPAMADGASDCRGVSELLGLVGDKWTIQVVVALSEQPRRFNDLKRQIGSVSQQMLTRNLRLLERDGLIERTVRPTTPPQVSYALTKLGSSLSGKVRPLADWAIEHRDLIRDNRRAFGPKPSADRQLAPETKPHDEVPCAANNDR